MSLILASSSPYRRQLLEKINLVVDVIAPNIDERVRPGESPSDLARRLSESKALAVAKQANGIIIASDQVACVNDVLLGKPGTASKAIEQLTLCSGQTVTFYTGLCLYNTETQTMQVTVVPFHVTFRTLSEQEIRNYIALESPLDCAGSFKSEGLGITLFECMQGNDPNALIGLPLIELCRMLRQEGINPLD